MINQNDVKQSADGMDYPRKFVDVTNDALYRIYVRCKDCGKKFGTLPGSELDKQGKCSQCKK